MARDDRRGAEMKIAIFIIVQMIVTTYGLMSLMIGREN
jgi:hypothetical protein